MEEHSNFSCIPYITVNDATAAIEWYQKALGAVLIGDVARDESGRVMNAQLKVGNGMFMLSDGYPEYGKPAADPASYIPFNIHLRSHSIDVDFKHAIDAGAISEMEPDNMFWGDRYASLKDPFGYSWGMGQPISEL